MPQLDKATFFTQIFWALLAYFFLYVLLSVYVCPAIGLTLKSRLRINLAGVQEEPDSSLAFLQPTLKIFNLAETTNKLSFRAFWVSKKASYSTIINYLK